MLDKLRSKDFAPYLNQTFRLYALPDEPISTELIQVTELGSGRSSNDEPARRQPFAIILRSPQRDSYLRQGIYRVEHEEMGSFDLFLVPIGPDGEGMCYEALFN